MMVQVFYALVVLMTVANAVLGPATASSPCPGSEHAVMNLQAKLKAETSSGEANYFSGGADYYKGAKAAVIYHYVDLPTAGSYSRELGEQLKPAQHVRILLSSE